MQPYCKSLVGRVNSTIHLKIKTKTNEADRYEPKEDEGVYLNLSRYFFYLVIFYIGLFMLKHIHLF